jgi:hypothetical protein
MAATTTPAPDWLTKRDGTLAPGIRDGVVFVMLSGHPQYRLDVRPAAGKHGCAVIQTVNGKRLDDGGLTYPTAAEAVAGGLDQLRQKLGW